MKVTARDVMVKDFDKIQSNAPIEEAVRLIFNGKVRKTGHKTACVMVIDEFNHLIGVLTMFDVLYHLRPPVLNYMVSSIDFWDEELESYVKHFKGLTVKQVMSSPVLFVAPDDDLMVVIDRMVRKKYRRLPVLEKSMVIGIVYLSEVYHHLCKNWLKTELG
ncbi:MAG: CBS domain-containing protein [Desulfobacterales bacterium]|jgi:CBS-domain-containing membrane protein